MANFEYSPTISLGNLIAILSIVLTGSGVYATMTSNDTKHDERIAQNSIEIHRVEQSLTEVIKDLKSELKESNRNLQEINNKLNRYELQSREKDRNSWRINNDVFTKPNTR